MKETPHQRAGAAGADGAQIGRSGDGVNIEDRLREPSAPMTPPLEARTDWPRGIGELGTEGMDPSQPLNEAPIRRGPAAAE